MAIYQSSFINEKQILAYDDSISQTLSTFERFFIDSMNHILGSRKSYDLLRKFSVEIRKAEIEINDVVLKNKEKKAPNLLPYFYKLLDERIQFEFEIMENRLTLSESLEKYIQQNMKETLRIFGFLSSDQLFLKTSRQKFLHSYLSSKFTRPMKMYKLINSNARTLKNMWKS
jgi:hypothetical protein